MSTVWYLRQQLPYKTACPQEGRHISTMSLSSSGYMDSGSGEFRCGPSRNPPRVCKWHLRASQGCQQQLNLNRLKVSSCRVDERHLQTYRWLIESRFLPTS